jgi:hypothetical protein
MVRGQRLPQPALVESRAHFLEQLRRLPARLPYPVEIAPALRALAEEVDRGSLTSGDRGAAGS